MKYLTNTAKILLCLLIIAACVYLLNKKITCIFEEAKVLEYDRGHHAGELEVVAQAAQMGYIQWGVSPDGEMIWRWVNVTARRLE